MIHRNFTPVFMFYLARKFFVGFFIVYCPVIILIYLIGLLELSRRFAKGDFAQIKMLFIMAALKLPWLTIIILPFVCLMGAIWTLTRLAKTNQLIIARASGMSVWQIMLPGLIVAMLIGMFAVTIINPLASAFNDKLQRFESFYIKKTISNLSSIVETGLWLRQSDDTGSAIIHAQAAVNQGRELRDVIALIYDKDDRFIKRVTAKTAIYQENMWLLQEAIIFIPENPLIINETYKLVTNIRPDDILQSFVNPDQISFWELQSYANYLERAGFSAVRYRLYWHFTAATPLLLCAMTLIAAIVSLNHGIARKNTNMIILAVVVGFLIHVIIKIVNALGNAEIISFFFAAWTPPIIAILVSGTWLLHLEDG